MSNSDMSLGCNVQTFLLRCFLVFGVMFCHMNTQLDPDNFTKTKLVTSPILETRTSVWLFFFIVMLQTTLSKQSNIISLTVAMPLFTNVWQFIWSQTFDNAFVHKLLVKICSQTIGAAPPK